MIYDHWKATNSEDEWLRAKAPEDAGEEESESIYEA